MLKMEGYRRGNDKLQIQVRANDRMLKMEGYRRGNDKLHIK